MGVGAKRSKAALSHLRMLLTAPEFYAEYSKSLGRRVPSDPDAAVIVTPEGYGKSFLVAHLLARGFKVVFCAKSNAQLIAKEREITEDWARDPEALKILRAPPKVARYESKAQNLQNALSGLGIGPDIFSLSSYEMTSPYAIAAVDEARTIERLAALFSERGLLIDAEEFFETEYKSYRAPPIDGQAADVILLSFAAFQAFCQRGRPWWLGLGLVASVDKRWIGEKGAEELVTIRRPFERVIVMVDDPDRSDVDWLRRVSVKAANELIQRRPEITARMIAEESPAHWFKKVPNPVFAALVAESCIKRNEKTRNTPTHKIVKLKASYFEERPVNQSIGYGFKPGRFKPKMVVTTTEMVTARYAVRTLERSGLKVVPRVDVFRTTDCDVTTIQTTITRARNHAVLLPIVELLKEEFPDENVTLIADSLDAEFNLSNNKGRNDLRDRTTVIKLSWPHPNIVATAMAHLSDLSARDYITNSISDAELKDGVDIDEEYLGDSHDEMVASLLGDLANQALGRNQGFRFQGKEAVLLVDSKWYRPIMRQGVLRYQLTPWSSEFPAFNKRTSERSILEVIQRHADRQSPLQKRLVDLIRKFERFGLSEEAKRLVQKLSSQQQAYFQKWLDKRLEEQTRVEEAEARKRRQNTEAVRRHREKKKAASG